MNVGTTTTNLTTPTASAPVLPRPEISAIDLDAADAAAVLGRLADLAETAGFVRPTFRAALLKREREHPTGLPTAIPVAIPHSDAEHVIAPGLGLARLKRPVIFQEMGGMGSEVEVSFVVMILVTEPHEQVTLLTRLIAVFQQDGWFDRIAAATTVEELVDGFTALLENGAAAAS